MNKNGEPIKAIPVSPKKSGPSTNDGRANLGAGSYEYRQERDLQDRVINPNA